MRIIFINVAMMGLLASGAMAQGNHNAETAKLTEYAQLFAAAQIIGAPQIIDCTLSGGTKTRCFSITVKPEPKSYTPGPWCPTHLNDGSEKAGIWFDKGTVYNADGRFLSQLNQFYDDDEWQMVNPESGAINVTTTKEQCAAAANPNVGPEYKNFCVECQLSFLDAGKVMTYTFPLMPQERLLTGFFGGDIRQSGAGVAFNGVRLDGPAPVEAILGAYTVAPFDDCGGHINLHVGYHYHAATDCLDASAQEGEDAAIIGLAMDGYKILSHAGPEGLTPLDLDRCNGHSSGPLGYHYHAGAEGANQILGCLKAEFGCVTEGDDRYCDASVRPKRPQ